MKVLPSYEEFKAFPASVKQGIYFMLAGWLWFYFAMYTILMKGNVSPRYLIGIAVCFVVLRINNVGRVLCVLAQIMVSLQVMIPTAGFFMNGRADLGLISGLIVVLFGISCYYLLVPETAAFFKAFNKREDTETAEDEARHGVDDLDTFERMPPHQRLGVPETASSKEIRTAYQRLEKNYNPKRLAHKSKAYQELAERRFRAIREAYETLMPKKSGKKARKNA
jgi:hypothetical protein